MMGKYKYILLLLLFAMIGVLVAVILPILSPKLFLQSIIILCLPIVGLLGAAYFLWLGEKFPGPSSDIAIVTFGLSFIASLIAGLAFLESTNDSIVLQEQLAELKKITAILESKE